MAKEKKLGLVLPGGGFNGSAQAGVLKFFEEKGIKFDYIIASSIGCINAAILGAKDGNAEKLCKFWWNIKGYHFLYPAWKEWLINWRVDSFFTNKKLEERILKIANIYDQRADIDIDISLLSLRSERVQYVSNHAPDFKEALWAGTAMPFIYPMPFLKNRGHQYVDGGLGRNDMILRCFENGCDYVVVINLIETQKTRAKSEEESGTMRSMISAAWRTATIIIKRVFTDSSGRDKYDNKRVVRIFLPRGTYFSTLFPFNWWFRKMIQVGYEEAERVFSTTSFFAKV